MARGAYIVADFGKTNAKLTLWSRAGECLAKEVRANAVPEAAPYRPLDVSGIGDWLVETLKRFAGEPVEAIIPVSHGAAVAGVRQSKPLPFRGGVGVGSLGRSRSTPDSPPPAPPLKGRGGLSFTPLDYEWPIPADILAAYQSQRDPFDETGSPAFPMGLNFGAQLDYLETLGALEGATLLPYAQYWAWWLSGAAVSEVTSLGCHSDLWSPAAGDFSTMAKRRGWATQFAPLAKAGDVIGTLTPEIATVTGLSKDVRIHAGLHDSNAALVAARGYPEIAEHEATVLSTGTWFVAMRSMFAQTSSSRRRPGPSPHKKVNPRSALLAGLDPGLRRDDGEWMTTLPETRDCLVNVDVNGNPVPSARFMGGREAELLGGVGDGLDGLDRVLTDGTMILPAQVQGSGPFQNANGRCLNGEPSPAATALYLALMAETQLSLIGTSNTLLIEGRFAENELFTRALASLRPDLTVYTASDEADVSFGALRMINPEIKPAAKLTRVKSLDVSLSAYQSAWKEKVEGL